MAHVDVVGGRCPVCEYDRLIMRYAPKGEFMFDACSRCGFAFAWEYPMGNHAMTHESFWRWYGPQVEVVLDAPGRQGVFLWCEHRERTFDTDMTIYNYKAAFIAAYRASQPEIFPLNRGVED